MLLLVGGELGFRALVPEARAGLEGFRRYLLTGVMRGYEARAYTNFQRSATNSNSFGFLDSPWTRARTAGVPRIVCLGSSTTEGGNPLGIQGSYPHLLERTLEARTGRDFEVLNAGISGWTSAEMLVAWFLTLQDFAPDVVVLHAAVNDLPPRFLSDFRADYSHWRKPIQTRTVHGLEAWLVRWSNLYVYYRLRGGRAPDIEAVSTDSSGPKVPELAEGRLPHETSLSFRRNIAAIARAARADGRQVVLMTMPTSPRADVLPFWRHGIEENNQHLCELCSEHGCLLVDAAQAFRSRPELNEQFIDLVHLQAPGNQAKAELVAEALSSWISSLSTEDARPPVKTRR